MIREDGHRLTSAATDIRIDSKPDIVLILADDLGYGDVRCLNPEGKIATPEIDCLAAAGRVFTDSHSSSAVCTPMRYGLMTGRYNWRSRLKSGVLGGTSPPLNSPHTPIAPTAAWRGKSGINVYADFVMQTDNVAAAHPEIGARLTGLLERSIAEGRSTPGPSRPNTGPVELRRR